MTAPLIRQVLRQFREVEDEADGKLAAEQRFEQQLVRYIDNEGRAFAFGGLVNLIASIARICEARSTLEGDDYEIAAIALDECAEKCDLKYREPA